MKIHVEADLVLVTADMIAERGQYLMVINGACVGVYTGKPPSESANFKLSEIDEPTNIRPPSRSPLARSPLALHGPAKPTPTKTSKLDHITAHGVYTTILEIAADVPVTARALSDAMGLSKKDPHLIQKISRILMMLIEMGYLTSERNGARKFKNYRLTDAAPKTADPLKGVTRVSPSTAALTARGGFTVAEAAE